MLDDEKQTDIPIFRLQGRLDAFQVPTLNEKFEKIYEGTSVPRVIVNLMNVVFIDSAAVETIVDWMKKARASGGDVKLSSLRQTIRMRFKIEQLAAFEIYSDDEAAARAFRED